MNAGRTKVDHLEEVREAVTEYVARKNPVEHQEREAAADQNQRDHENSPVAFADAERLPFEGTKDP
jgi:hypothetical protein